MSASTITRDTWTNDSGSISAPNGDGTILANTVLQNHIYARVDQMFAGAGSYTTFTLGGKFAAEGFGTHSLSSSGTGLNLLSIRNTTAGTSNGASLYIGNDSNVALLVAQSYSSTFTSVSGFDAQNGSVLYQAGAGGLSLVTGDATASMRFYTNATERMRIHASGGISLNSASDPGASTVSITGAMIYAAAGAVGAPSMSFAAHTNMGWYNPASTDVSLAIGGAEYARFTSITSSPQLYLPNGDRSSGSGSFLTIGRNSNVSNTAPGFISFTELGGSTVSVWVDGSDQLRIWVNNTPLHATDTSGTIVGTQTSQRSTKNVLGRFEDREGALDLIRRTPLYRFTYKNGAYNDTEFLGIVADDSPEFAMDHGRSFNPISTCGTLIAAVQELADRLDVLEMRRAA